MTPEAVARKLFSIRRFRRRGYAKDLANELGCSPSAVYNWRALMRVPPDRVDDICRLLEIQPMPRIETGRTWCRGHVEVVRGGYVEWLRWAKDMRRRGYQSRQCPKCKGWFFRVEWGDPGIAWDEAKEGGAI